MTAQLTALPAALRTRIREAGDCWLWTGARTGINRYPTLGATSVNRQTWLAVTGEQLHPGESVFRSCESPGCVNPDHHYIGAPVARRAS